jgi:hypothetical protein
MIRQGVEESGLEKWRGKVVVGSQEFVERVGKLLKANKREQPQWKDGGMEYGAVSETVRRMERRLVTDKQLRNTQRKIMTDMLNIET